MDVSVRRLRYFIAVAEHGNFGRAAQALFLSPTALSEQIRKLEGEFGVRLFDRNPRGAQLTEIGAALADPIRELLDQAERIGRMVDQQRRRDGGGLRLGFVDLAAGELTPLIVTRFQKRHPDRTLELVHLSYAEQTAAVIAGHVDASIARGPIDDPRLSTVLLATEPRMAMVSSSHRLAGRDSVECADLAREVRVNTEGVPERWRSWWSLDPGADGSSPPYGPMVHSFDEQIELAASGVAMSIVPAAAGEAYRRQDVRFIPITDAEPSEVLLCTRADDLSSLVSSLRSLCVPEPGPVRASGKNRR